MHSGRNVSMRTVWLLRFPATPLDRFFAYNATNLLRMGPSITFTENASGASNYQSHSSVNDDIHGELYFQIGCFRSGYQTSFDSHNAIVSQLFPVIVRERPPVERVKESAGLLDSSGGRSVLAGIRMHSRAPHTDDMAHIIFLQVDSL